MYDFYPEAKADDRLQQDQEAGFAETRGKKSPAVICQDKNNIERYTFSYVSKRQKHPPKPCKSYF